METFEIEITGTHYKIVPTESGTFKVHDGDNYLGEIEPHLKADGSNEWITADLMGEDFAQQIGELIEEHEM